MRNAATATQENQMAGAVAARGAAAKPIMPPLNNGKSHRAHAPCSRGTNTRFWFAVACGNRRTLPGAVVISPCALIRLLKYSPGERSHAAVILVTPPPAEILWPALRRKRGSRAENSWLRRGRQIAGRATNQLSLLLGWMKEAKSVLESLTIANLGLNSERFATQRKLEFQLHNLPDLDIAGNDRAHAALTHVLRAAVQHLFTANHQPDVQQKSGKGSRRAPGFFFVGAGHERFE